MSEQDIHLTKRHFFRRLLSQKVERLETREAELEAEGERLEQELERSSVSEPDEYTGLKDTVARTQEKIASIGGLTRAEADLTIKRVAHEETKLLALLEKVRLEHRRPNREMGEIATEVYQLGERAESSAEFLIQQGKQEQARLTSELERLYSERVDWHTTIAKVRQNLHNLQLQAAEALSLLVAQARRERKALLERTRDLHERLVQLHTKGDGGHRSGGRSRKTTTGRTSTGASVVEKEAEAEDEPDAGHVEIETRTEARPAGGVVVSGTERDVQLAQTARHEREKLLSNIATHRVDDSSALQSSLPLTRKDIPLRKSWVVTGVLLAGLGLAALLGIAGQAPRTQYIFLILLTFVTVTAFTFGNGGMSINVLALSLAIYALFHLQVDVPATFIDFALHSLLLMAATLAAWKVSRYLRQVQRTASQQGALIQQLTSLDPETGAIQMNYLQLRLAEEVARTSRYKDPLAVMALQPAGRGAVTKEMKKRLSQLLDSSLRRADNMGLGEDGKWMLVLPETDLYSAEEVANRLMKVAHEQFGVVLRIGIAAFPEDGTDGNELLRQAQHALELALRDDIPVVSRALAKS